MSATYTQPKQSAQTQRPLRHHTQPAHAIQTTRANTQTTHTSHKSHTKHIQITHKTQTEHTLTKNKQNTQNTQIHFCSGHVILDNFMKFVDDVKQTLTNTQKWLQRWLVGLQNI